ncbi:MAG: hypothetical protein ACJ8D5_00030 [Sphingomicrobium sp.]
MTASSIVLFLVPWRLQREKARQLDALRRRDGDNCRRCRRSIRFDLPSGHGQAPKLEPMMPGSASKALDNLCLCHTRCNADAGDSTVVVLERVRAREEQAAKRRKTRKRAA